MGKYDIQAPDGRVVTVEGPAPPNAQQMAAIFAGLPPKTAAEKPEPGLLDRFMSRSPMGMAGISQVPGAIMDVAQTGAMALPNVVKAGAGVVADTIKSQNPIDLFNAARERGQSVPYSALASIPFVGPAADTVTQDLYHMRVPELAADAINLAPLAIGSKAPVLNKPIGEVARDVGGAVKNVATHPVTVGAGAAITTLAATENPIAALAAGASGAASAAALRALKDPGALDYMAAAPGKIGYFGKILKAIAGAPEKDAVKLIKDIPADEYQAMQDSFKAAQAEVRILERADRMAAKGKKAGTKIVPPIAETPQPVAETPQSPQVDLKAKFDSAGRPDLADPATFKAILDKVPAKPPSLASSARTATDIAEAVKRTVVKLHKAGQPTATIVDAIAGIPEVGFKGAPEAVSLVMDELKLADNLPPKGRQDLLSALKASVKKTKKP